MIFTVFFLNHPLAGAGFGSVAVCIKQNICEVPRLDFFVDNCKAGVTVRSYEFSISKDKCTCTPNVRTTMLFIMLSRDSWG